VADFISSPENAARQKVELSGSVGPKLNRRQQEMYLGTWAACQAYVELGGDADKEAIIAHAESVLDIDDPSKSHIPLVVSEVRWGEHGLLISEPAWQERQQALMRVASEMGQLIELSGGEI